MKKYPVIYKGKEYEVRWEQLGIDTYLTIYEVQDIKIFNKIKIKKRYINKYSRKSYDIEVTSVSIDNPNYHIEKVKKLFKLWEKILIAQEEREKIIRAKEQALEEWDGVIDE